MLPWIAAALSADLGSPEIETLWSPKGLAVTGADTVAGTRRYTLDGGTTWTNVPAVSDTNALLLADNPSTELQTVKKATELSPNAFISWPHLPPGARGCATGQSLEFR